MQLKRLSSVFLLSLLPFGPSMGGTLVGHVRDQSWYARYQSYPYGVGYYELAVNANGTNLSSPGGSAATDVFGSFQMPNLPAGPYTVASWDVWWRSAYAFNVNVPASGSSADADLRLQATMWGYPAFWDDAGYYEFGQTFTATGPISMIYLRDPLRENFTRTVTVRAGGPGGPQVGETRTYGGNGDQRLIYGYGQMPTVKGQTYYLRLRTPSPGTGAVIMQMDPRPDYSDPMPGGCLHLGNGTTLTPYPDRDLGVIIMSDDDGLITNLYTRQGGSSIDNVTSVGQSFIARGVNLVSAAFWLADPSGPTYVVRLRENGPGGAQVGTTKRGKPARLFADPEMIVAWAPGECPLTPGQTYYLEVTKDGGGVFNVVYARDGNPFVYGQAYANGTALSGRDLAGTIMEEESPGSATRPAVPFTTDLSVADSDRGVHELTIRWRTQVPGHSLVEYALDAPPYTHAVHGSNLTTAHAVTLRGLESHRMYHYRITSSATNYRPAISRDLVVCTRPATPNLLVNPGFEEGSGPSPRSAVPGWTRSGIDLQASDGTWSGGLTNRSGSWFLQGQVNGGTSEGYVYQRVSGVTPGRLYTFSAWVATWPQENNTWKYDVWNDQNRLIYMRLGIDPTGGTDPNASTVQWTPRMYSHLRYNNPARNATAQGTNLTVFIGMKGRLSYGDNPWHLYGVDDCVLSVEEPPPTQPFETVPDWDSTFEESGGSAATFSVVPGGLVGNALQATRSSPGSSTRVQVFPVLSHTTYLVSINIRCPASTDVYAALTALKPGDFTAADLEADPGSWTTLQQFSNPGDNGNGDTWTQYSAVFDSGSNTRLSVGVKLTSSTGTGPAVQWDSLRIDPFAYPVPVRAVADRAAKTVTVTFSGPLELGTATSLTNYAIYLPGAGAGLPLLNVGLTNANETVLATGPQAVRADYLLVVSNVVDAGRSPGPRFVNGEIPLRVPHNLIAIDTNTFWRYDESGTNHGTTWREPTFDDGAWPTGAALLAFETCGCLPEPIRTTLTTNTSKLTYYFRKSFVLPEGATNAPLRLRHVIDDGAVFYLNGGEFYRVGMTNPVTHAATAARVVNNAAYEEAPCQTATNLMNGQNVLAVEVHQINDTSSDIVFGAALDALLLPSQLPVPHAELTIAQEGRRVVVSWDVPGMTLVTGGAPTGPWYPIVGARSPLTNIIRYRAQFYRLRE